MENKNSLYLVLTIILIILSAIGGYFLFNIYNQRSSSNYTSSTTPKIELIPTDSVQNITDQDSSVSSEIITPTVTKTNPIASATATPKVVLTPSPSISPTTSKDVVLYENKEDGFSVSHTNQRLVHKDSELSGNRYTFVNKAGNFAVHVSPTGKWSWTHPDRQFTTTLLVSGQKTFRYDITTQTIIDLQSDSKNYTLQCIHNGLESLKTECDQFVSSFKIL
jgi:hypothetical protein